MHGISRPVGNLAESTPHRRPRRFDPWVVVVAAVALGTYLLHGFQGLFSRDLGVYAYGARQVLAGQPPYVGIVNRAGPLAHLLPVPGIVAARLVGQDELLGMRVWYMVLAVACVVLTYVVGRQLFGSRAAGLAAAATMLSFQGFIDLATTGPREKTPMVLFIVCAIWALSHRRWLWTGVSISLATLTLQTAFFPLLVAVVVAVLLGGSPHKLRDLGRFAVGGAIPVAVLVVYFAAYGAVSDLADGFFLLNLRYSTGTPFTSNISPRWESIRAGYGASLWLLFGGLALVLVVTVLRVADRSRRRDPVTVTIVALAVATVGSVLWFEVDFDSYLDSFTLLPLAALGIAAGIAELELRASRRTALVVASLAVVLPTLLAVHYSVTVHDTRLQHQRAAMTAMLAEVPGAHLWSLGTPEYLVLAKQANPTRYQLLQGGLDRHLADTWPGGRDAFVAWNLARQPDLIPVSALEMEFGQWKPVLEPDYVKVGVTPGAVWFARRSLGPDVIQAIRHETTALNARDW